MAVSFESGFSLDVSIHHEPRHSIQQSSTSPCIEGVTESSRASAGT
jgi:hypothetical protein